MAACVSRSLAVSMIALRDVAWTAPVCEEDDYQQVQP